MAFCSFSNDTVNYNFTSIENQFITKYLPFADGDSVKVYLFGLYLCQNVSDDFTIAEMSSSLNMSENSIIDAFKYWEEFDIIQILSYEPFAVKYLPATFSKGRPKKYNPQKYTDFCKALQSLKPNSSITPTEYTEYFQVMEEYDIKPDAMLIIIKYCFDKKGEGVSYKYVSKVAQSFASEGNTTAEKLEEKLADYSMYSSDIGKVLTALGSTKKPEVLDSTLLKKWTDTLSFELEAIIFLAKKSKTRSMEKLDLLIEELYANKKFSQSEIKEYLKEKNNILTLTMTVAHELGIYVENLEHHAKTYTAKWLSKGYGSPEIITLAKFAWRRKKRTFEELDEDIDKLFTSGIVSMESITEYMNAQVENDKYITKILDILGISRKPTKWDRESLKNWRSWNFADEMIEEAAKRSTNASSPIPYMTSILSSWKSKNIFSVEQIEGEKFVQSSKSYTKKAKENEFVTLSNNRKYTEEDYNNLIDSWEDIEI